eukprot:8737272-Heterocapsa_arctica.AAC.1
MESLQIFGGYAKAARRLGLQVTTTGPVDLIAASLTPEHVAKQIATVLKDAGLHGASWIILDGCPQSASLCVELLQQAGWQVSVDSRLHSELGDAIAQRRCWILATDQGPLPDEEWIAVRGGIRSFAPPMSQMLDEVNKIAPDAWLHPPWELILDPRTAAGREGTLPKLVGS